MAAETKTSFEKNFMISTVDYVFNGRASQRSGMTFGLAAAPSEMIASSTSRFDIGLRLEVFRPAAPEHLMIVAGTYAQMRRWRSASRPDADPKWVISMGAARRGRPQY